MAAASSTATGDVSPSGGPTTTCNANSGNTNSDKILVNPGNNRNDSNNNNSSSSSSSNSYNNNNNNNNNSSNSYNNKNRNSYNNNRNSYTNNNNSNSNKLSTAVDNEQGARDVGKESGDQGHQHQPIIAGNEGNDSTQQRRTSKGGIRQELRERIRQTYQTKTANLVARYNKLGSQLADFANNVAFFTRCVKMSMIPKNHRVYNYDVRNTRIVIRILDQCCYKILMADLEHNRRRRYQIQKDRIRIESRLRKIMSTEDFAEVQKICEENKESRFSEVKEKQRSEFEELIVEYKAYESGRQLQRQQRNRRSISSDQRSSSLIIREQRRSRKNSRSSRSDPHTGPVPAAGGSGKKNSSNEFVPQPSEQSSRNNNNNNTNNNNNDDDDDARQKNSTGAENARDNNSIESENVIDSSNAKKQALKKFASSRIDPKVSPADPRKLTDQQSFN